MTKHKQQKNVLQDFYTPLKFADECAFETIESSMDGRKILLIAAKDTNIYQLDYYLFTDEYDFIASALWFSSKNVIRCERNHLGFFMQFAK